MSLGKLLDIVHASDLTVEQKDPIVAKIFAEGNSISRMFNNDFYVSPNEVVDIVDGFLYTTTFDVETLTSKYPEAFYQGFRDYILRELSSNVFEFKQY